MDYTGHNIEANFLRLLSETKYAHDLKENHVENRYTVKEVIGAGWLSKRDVVRTIGIFDPVYFMYYNDTDDCRRVDHGGRALASVSNSIVYHHHTLIP